MNLKCLLLPASRNRIAGKRSISKYLPVDIRIFVCIETYVFTEQARVNHFNCSTFLRSHAQCSCNCNGRNENAGTKQN